LKREIEAFPLLSFSVHEKIPQNSLSECCTALALCGSWERLSAGLEREQKGAASQCVHEEMQGRAVLNLALSNQDHLGLGAHKIYPVTLSTL